MDVLEGRAVIGCPEYAEWQTGPQTVEPLSKGSNLGGNPYILY